MGERALERMDGGSVRGYILAAAKGDPDGPRGLKVALQVAALRALAKDDSGRHVRLFESLLSHDDALVRLATAEGLGRIGEARSVEPLAIALEKESSQTTMIALVWAIRDIHRFNRDRVKIDLSSEGAPRGVQHIKAALDTFVKVGNVRRAAALHSILGTTYLADAGVEQDYHEAGRHAQAAVDLLVDEEDSLDKAMACSRLAFWYERDLDLDRAEELAREALRSAEAVQVPDAMTWACTTLGLVLVQRGHLDQGLSYAERGLAEAQKARTPWARERAAANPIHMYPWLADVGCYEEWFTRWEDLQRPATALRHESQVLGVMAAVSFQGGNSERGQAFLARIAQVAPDASFEWHGVVLAMLGDREAAERDFASLDWTGQMGFRPSAIRSARHYGQLLLDQDEPERTEELLRSQWEFCRERGAVTLELDLLPPLCESYLRQGRLEEAHACLERAREILAMPEDWRGLASGVALAEALVAATEKRWAAAVAAFQQAADTNRQYGLLYDQAGAMYKWAVMHLDRGVTYPERIEGRVNPRQDRMRGLELLDQSLALFLRCDAKKDVERAVTLREQMEALAPKAPEYPDGLTQREVEVLRLVAGGKTDREIAEELLISTRTVTTHVSNIRDKIRAANRTEAASYATRNGLA